MRLSKKVSNEELGRQHRSAAVELSTEQLDTGECGPQELDRLITYRELSDSTGLALGTLYAGVARKEIPHLRLGKRLVRFRRADLQAWLDRHVVPIATDRGST